MPRPIAPDESIPDVNPIGGVEKYSVPHTNWQIRNYPLLSQMEAFGRGVIRSAKTVADKLPGPESPVPPEIQQELEGEDRAFQQEYPSTYAAGQLPLPLAAASGLGRAVGLIPGMAPAAPGAGALEKVGRGIGGAVGAGATNAAVGAAFDPVGKSGDNLGTDFLLGAVPGAVASSAINWIKPKATPEAQYWLKRGVPLTYAQTDPKSFLAKQERLATSGPLGTKIQEMQDRAKQISMEVHQAEHGVPPGKALPPGGTTGERLEAMDELFAEKYRELGKDKYATRPTLLQMVKEMQDMADNNPFNIPGRGVSNSTVGATSNSMSSGLSTLPAGSLINPKTNISQLQEFNSLGDWVSSKVPPPVSLDDLIQARRGIKADRRAAMRGSNYDQARSLEWMDRPISDAIEATVGPSAAPELAATQRAYKNLAVMEEAASTGGGATSNYTYRRLGAKAKQRAGRKGGAQDETGDMGEVARMGEPVFEDIPPRTGERFEGNLFRFLPGKAGEVARHSAPYLQYGLARAINTPYLRNPGPFDPTRHMILPQLMAQILRDQEEGK